MHCTLTILILVHTSQNSQKKKLVVQFEVTTVFINKLIDNLCCSQSNADISLQSERF